MSISLSGIESGSRDILGKPVLISFRSPGFVPQTQQWEEITNIFLECLRCPLCLQRLHWLLGSPVVSLTVPITSIENKGPTPSYELCHEAGHVMPRWQSFVGFTQ